MLAALLLSLLLTSAAAPEPVRVVSYNVENFRENFTAFQLQKKYRDADLPEDVIDLIDRERREDREENLEVAAVILELRPDVLALQESAGKRDLEYFNKEFLGGHFGTIVELPTNTDRDQHLCVMLRPGFEVVRQVSLAEMPDADDLNERGDRLFARGPGFLLIETPGGERFWLGNTHQKSKGGNSALVTRWRNAEARATRDEMLELADGREKDVLLVGDMNDDLGLGEYEAEGGGDVMANFTDGVALLTRPLIDAGAVSYVGYGGSDRTSMIDHAVATKTLAGQVDSVELHAGPMTAVASDHLPLIVDLKLGR